MSFLHIHRFTLPGITCTNDHFVTIILLKLKRSVQEPTLMSNVLQGKNNWTHVDFKSRNTPNEYQMLSTGVS